MPESCATHVRCVTFGQRFGVLLPPDANTSTLRRSFRPDSDNLSRAVKCFSIYLTEVVPRGR
jgi:hypothetical protein